jgi:hypothetical protein
MDSLVDDSQCISIYNKQLPDRYGTLGNSLIKFVLAERFLY